MHLNNIEAQLVDSEHIHDLYLQFFVDGNPLDYLLSAKQPKRGLKGMVPTTLNWLHDSCEQAEVWSRFRTRKGGEEVIPLMCCPDDLNFSCALVVADAKYESRSVSWLRFGVDTTPVSQLPSRVGSCVEWFNNVGPFRFDRIEYEQMVRQFEEFTSESNGLT